MSKHLPTDIKALARSHTESALKVLTGIMRSTKAPPSARVAAALGVLDRGWGKAPQAIELSGEVASKVIRTPAKTDSIDAWQKQFSDQPQPKDIN